MKLSKEQLEQFHEEGYLFLPEVFTPEELSLIHISEPTRPS